MWLKHHLNWEKHALQFSGLKKNSTEGEWYVLSAWEEEINVLSQSKYIQLGQDTKTKQGIKRDDIGIRVDI